jgi:hypothetical protein
MEATAKLKLSEYSGIGACISAALSLITTACQAAMEAFEKEQLI